MSNETNQEQGTALEAKPADETVEIQTPAAPAANTEVETGVEVEAKQAQPEEPRTEAITVEEVLAEDKAAAEESAKAEPEKELEAKADADKPKPEAEKELTVSQLRRKKRAELKAKAQQEITAKDTRIAELEAQVKVHTDNIVDTDTAQDYDEAILGNATHGALGAQKQAELDAARGQRDTAAANMAAKSHSEFTEKGKELEGVKDFEAVVYGQDVPFTSDTVDVLRELNNGPKMAYDLATKPDELNRLNAMSPMQRAIELGRMDAVFKAPTAVKKTTAPKPIKPTGSGSTATGKKPESEMSFAEMNAELGYDPKNPGHMKDK